jgi:anaerobic selenocysteine-containing dehydrogenase
MYTYGAAVPGGTWRISTMPAASCTEHNPSVARLTHTTSTAPALARGARLINVDPLPVGLASKADHWLRVRPGTDAALALSLTHVMIEHGWFDEDFVRVPHRYPLESGPTGADRTPGTCPRAAQPTVM